MNVQITPGAIHGSIVVPPSKSHTQRVLAAALLHQGITNITNSGSSDDEKAVLNIIEQLEATVIKKDETITIKSSGIKHQKGVIHCGESGLAARLFTPIVALSDHPITILGKGSLLKRPMKFSKEYLCLLDVSVEQANDFLPITITGPLQPKTIDLDGSLSSQFLSGLLLTYAFSAKEEVTINVKNLVSKPYINLTLSVLEQFGKKLVNHNYEAFSIIPSTALQNKTITINVEADWSSAAYWIVAGLFFGSIQLQGLDEASMQADRAILDVVMQCGGEVIWENTSLIINSQNTLSAFHFDATNCPDLFPILAILATQCNGTSTIKGLQRLIHKESNRRESIEAMLMQLGVDFEMEDDKLLINGSSVLQTTSIRSFNDHRIAMAAAIAALKAEGDIIINDAECVSKSYPDFFKHLQELGASITIAP